MIDNAIETYYSNVYMYYTVLLQYDNENIEYFTHDKINIKIEKENFQSINAFCISSNKYKTVIT